MDLLREYIREALLAEYVVPMGYSLESWLKKKEKERILATRSMLRRQRVISGRLFTARHDQRERARESVA